MPISLHYDTNIEAIRGTVTDSFSFEEFKELSIQIVESKDIPSDANAIWDCRDLDFSTLNTTFMRELVNIREKFNTDRGSAKIAVIVKSDVGHGMIRIYQTLSDLKKVQQGIAIFRNDEDATAWILSA